MLRSRATHCPSCGVSTDFAASCPNCETVLVKDPLVPATIPFHQIVRPRYALPGVQSLDAEIRTHDRREFLFRFVAPAIVIVTLALKFGLTRETAAQLLPFVAVPLGLVLVATVAFRAYERTRARRWVRPVARAAAAASAGASAVSVIGRVRMLGSAYGSEHAAVARGAWNRCGRFVVEDETGSALVDDDEIEIVDPVGQGPVAKATVRNGDRVLVHGPARMADIEADGYRGAARMLAFDGRIDAPVRIAIL